MSTLTPKFKKGDVAIFSKKYTDSWIGHKKYECIKKIVFEITYTFKYGAEIYYSTELIYPQTQEVKSLFMTITGHSNECTEAFITKIADNKKQLTGIKNVGDLINI